MKLKESSKPLPRGVCTSCLELSSSVDSVPRPRRHRRLQLSMAKVMLGRTVRMETPSESETGEAAATKIQGPEGAKSVCARTSCRTEHQDDLVMGAVTTRPQAARTAHTMGDLEGSCAARTTCRTSRLP